MSVEIQKAQRAMAAELAAADRKFIKATETVEAAERTLGEAQAELDNAQEALETVDEEFQTLQTKYKQFLDLFPIEEGSMESVAPKAAKKKDAKNHMTMIEKMLSVMGDTTMSAGQIENALVQQNLAPTGNNLRSYIHTLLGQQTQKVKDAAGNNLRDPQTNELVRVLVFQKVERGLYRVNKVDATKILTDLAPKQPAVSSDVLLVNSNQSPADALFASQGLDVNSLVPSSSTLS